MENARTFRVSLRRLSYPGEGLPFSPPAAHSATQGQVTLDESQAIDLRRKTHTDPLITNPHDTQLQTYSVEPKGLKLPPTVIIQEWILR